MSENQKSPTTKKKTPPKKETDQVTKESNPEKKESNQTKKGPNSTKKESNSAKKDSTSTKKESGASKKESNSSKKEGSSSKKEKQVTIDGAADIIPEKLRLYVSQEIWSLWSPIRRESFKSIIKNPNSFFYRNRPPGDPQKCGPFTQAEEDQFLERLRYFREELGIEDGLWGYFSVPISGRLGYQCSNFYRLLIKTGKVKDDHYEVQEDGKLKFIHNSRSQPTPEVMAKLEKEAFDYIQKCLKSEDGEVPQVSMPIIVHSENTTSRPMTQKPYKVTRASHEIIKYIGHQRSLRERRYIQQPRPKGAKGYNLSNNIHTFIEENRCPLYGAIDPMSEEPIETPMMDKTGFVMDLRSWRRVFRHNEMPPCDYLANDESDLIELTAKNFNQFRLFVTNIVC
ncbi:hypothetical protein TRFO_03891 [Tritrichomonas foetus]|uniref:Myb-like domain-containing protein n=1 Tax=Tritrichomonas foetus TaxID=1144522 RepID=A0A1J4KQF9_9EUKA|nr:hypothetical protein TRFO_03891 [Tritrichomonas foetus]|eukprot:OHT11669.1 hypothetical protein TRFO_03891 [Tritrichomonas foetus]